MPPHPDRVRLNYVCPYCASSLMDGKHSYDKFSFAYMIGCPKHPIDNPQITILDPKKFRDE